MIASPICASDLDMKFRPYFTAQRGAKLQRLLQGLQEVAGRVEVVAAVGRRDVHLRFGEHGLSW
jgi:hypothetical protein